MWTLCLLYYEKNNKQYNATSVKIVEYDRDKNVLLIRIIEELIPDFSNLTADDIKIISDLKFLIQNIKRWYERYGLEVSHPKGHLVLKDESHKITYLPEFVPSVDQINALRSVLEHPFTYIWGAHGTGKTQFVLAYALLHSPRLHFAANLPAAKENMAEENPDNFRKSFIIQYTSRILAGMCCKCISVNRLQNQCVVNLYSMTFALSSIISDRVFLPEQETRGLLIQIGQ